MSRTEPASHAKSCTRFAAGRTRAASSGRAQSWRSRRRRERRWSSPSRSLRRSTHPTALRGIRELRLRCRRSLATQRRRPMLTLTDRWSLLGHGRLGHSIDFLVGRVAALLARVRGRGGSISLGLRLLGCRCRRLRRARSAVCRCFDAILLRSQFAYLRLEVVDLRLNRPQICAGHGKCETAGNDTNFQNSIQGTSPPSSNSSSAHYTRHSALPPAQRRGQLKKSIMDHVRRQGLGFSVV